MTEQEHKLIENLTKQLELSNKIALKQMQDTNTPSVNEERLNEAEIGLLDAKKSFFEKSATLISNINILIGLLAFFACIGALMGLNSCASIF